MDDSSIYPPLLTGRGEPFLNSDTSQLVEDLFEVDIMLPASWLGRQFTSPAAAAAFVNSGMAPQWPRIVAQAQGRRSM